MQTEHGACRAPVGGGAQAGPRARRQSMSAARVTAMLMSSLLAQAQRVHSQEISKQPQAAQPQDHGVCARTIFESSRFAEQHVDGRMQKASHSLRSTDGSTQLGVSGCGRRRCWHACRCATHLCRAAHALLRQEHSHPRENPVHGLAAARDFTLRPLELPRHDGVAKAHGAPPPPPMPEAERADICAKETRRWCCESRFWLGLG